ncbi:uncharacterized protein LOC123659212 [Melitaea cinxia]|uniref:uncharacterized protein LOC123659212 n=1 Tax=Melitaea cinxia TaxID=113334 RepID=UPI001E26F56F|nr:uncharacterized protein LOC123659212 [Melitaea cinxia]
MNDLLQSQIHESCKLALPEGLKDLMSDISREVLRAQPQNLNQFIANYLESLLEVREALAIACRICNETCECSCESGLRRELMAVGLDEEDLDKAKSIFIMHISYDTVNEPSIFIKLMEKVNIDEFYIPSIQEAIQRAFKRQNLQNIKSNYLQNDHYVEAKTAVQHTMQIYKSKPEGDPCVSEIENIIEQVIDDESENESIFSLINESLTTSDDSIDEDL